MAQCQEIVVASEERGIAAGHNACIFESAGMEVHFVLYAVMDRTTVHDGVQFPLKRFRETVTLIRIMGVHQAYITCIVHCALRVNGAAIGFSIWHFHRAEFWRIMNVRAGHESRLYLLACRAGCLAPNGTGRA